MPNWCVNRLAIAGPPAAVKLLVEELVSSDAALDFAALRPTPPELLADQPVPAEGFPDWYRWRRTHWGVKWNASDVTRRAKFDVVASAAEWLPATPGADYSQIVRPNISTDGTSPEVRRAANALRHRLRADGRTTHPPAARSVQRGRRQDASDGRGLGYGSRNRGFCDSARATAPVVHRVTLG